MLFSHDDYDSSASSVPPVGSIVRQLSNQRTTNPRVAKVGRARARRSSRADGSVILHWERNCGLKTLRGVGLAFVARAISAEAGFDLRRRRGVAVAPWATRALRTAKRLQQTAFARSENRFVRAAVRRVADLESVWLMWSRSIGLRTLGDLRSDAAPLELLQCKACGWRTRCRG